jgi:hypothetical protein
MTSLSRLFTPTGQPPLSLADRRFLRELGRLRNPLALALFELEDALAMDDVEMGVVAARRALSTGALLGAAAREVEGL